MDNYANQIGHNRHGDSPIQLSKLALQIEMHTSDNFLNRHNDSINAFTLSNLPECVYLSVFFHVGT